MDFSTLKAITIPEGVATKIVSAGKTLWQAVTYKNWVPLSIDTDGSIFNGVGWQGGYRVRSGGAVGANTYAAATGFIPVKAGDVIYFTAGQYGIWGQNAVASNCIFWGKEDFSAWGSFTTQPAYYGNCTANNSVVTQISEKIWSITVPNDPTIKYMRMSMNGNYSDGRHGAEFVITINEEIV